MGDAGRSQFVWVRLRCVDDGTAKELEEMPADKVLREHTDVHLCGYLLLLFERRGCSCHARTSFGSGPNKRNRYKFTSMTDGLSIKPAELPRAQPVI